MPLPKIATPTYELELPSTGESIQFRPFLVKEEKVLVLALESEDTKQITTAIKAVIKSCVQTKGIKVIRAQRNSGILSPIIHTIPVQLLAYHVALRKGTDVDKPRNLAKSVTVE